ncbi:MAG: SDR family oxidoreductase [Robiginitalea sp.]
MNYALVIGGSRGLGLATVQKLLSEGIPVIAIHRDFKKDLPEVLEAFRAFETMPTPFHAIHRDAIRKADSILITLREILGEEGKIGFLVHSIARGNLKPMAGSSNRETLTADDFAITGQAMAFNLYTWVRSLYREGLFGTEPRIIAFTSEGSKRVIPGYGAVAAAKAALEAIVRQIAVEFAGRGLRANCVQAGVTNTDSLRRIPDSDRLISVSLKRNPSGRLTLPEDVANVVYLLCREEASWLTGNVIKADGGESLC